MAFNSVCAALRRLWTVALFMGSRVVDDLPLTRPAKVPYVVEIPDASPKRAQEADVSGTLG